MSRMLWMGCVLAYALLPSLLSAQETQLSYLIDGLSSQIGQNRKIDWSVPLGGGNIAAGKFPYLYRASINTADCVNDYALYALNVAGVTGGQANLVGINELYSGSNPTGLCGTQPNVNWAYNGSTSGGKIVTNTVVNASPFGPAPYGTKVAYVESAPHTSVFHILTWKAGEGTSATASAQPTQSGSCTTSSSCLVSLTYSTTSTTTFASPDIDWKSDKAWVASDDGTIYQISCVFTCPLNSTPQIDWSFKLPVAGTGGALPQPGEPVYDLNNEVVYVADQLGELWAINAAGTPTLFAGPLMIGGGGCTTINPPGRTGTPNPCTANGGSYGLADGPQIDESVGKVYVLSGNDGTAGASAVVSQMNLDFSDLIQARIGLGSVGNTTTNVDIHLPTFDYAWDNNLSNAHMIICGTGTNDTTPYLYSIGFSAWPEMDSTALQGVQRIAVAGVACTPLTEVYNPNIDLGGNPNDHDMLASGLVSQTYGAVITDDITSEPALALNFVTYPGGISGIWWDNVTTEPQASSIYFSTLGVVNVGSCNNARCAVKLTQLNLQ